MQISKSSQELSVLDPRNLKPIVFNVSLAFTNNVYKWIHAKMPALKM